MKSFASSSFVAFATLTVSTTAHLTMVSPKPFPGTSGSGPSRSPLDPAGANYPCQATGADYYKAGSVSNSAAIGEDVPLKFDPLGTAVHGGGSCQVSLTTDLAPSKDSKWMVIHSIEGGCPSKTATGNLQPGQHADDYTFKIPDGIVAGQYVMAWTWFNKIGNREMYMNCAPFTITGGSGGGSSANTTSNEVEAEPAASASAAAAPAGSATGTSNENEASAADTSCDDEDDHADTPAGAATPAAGTPGMKRRIEARKEMERMIKRQNNFPNIYLANICGGQCTTTESTDVKFPDPGASVEMFAPESDLKLQTCSCPGAGGAGGAASPASGSGTPAASGTSGESPSSAAGTPLGQATGSAAAGGAGGGAATNTAAAPSAPAATAASSAPAAEAPSSSAAAAAPSSAAAAAAPSAASSASGSSGASSGSSGSASSGTSGTQSCSGGGSLVCSSDGTLFGICDANNQAVMRAVAPGTACVNGAIAAAAGGASGGSAAAGGASSAAAPAASAASSGGM